jgi:PAS domain S-box-containing protein
MPDQPCDSLQDAQADRAIKIVIDASPVGTVVFNADARVHYINPLGERLFGRSASASIGLGWGDFTRCARRHAKTQGCGHIPACPACPLFRAIEAALADEPEAAVRQGEALLERDSGFSPIWVKYTVSRLVINGCTAAIMAVDDITDRKRYEEKLHNALTELSAIHDHAPVAMMLLDRERRIRKVNGFAARFADRPAAEMIGMYGGEALRCLHHLDDPRGCGFGPACADCHVRKAVLEAFETRSSKMEVEAWLPFPRGETVEDRCLLISTAYMELDGSERVLVCSQDITKRKRAEDALRESEARLQAIIKSNANPIVVYDANGHPQYLNPAFAEVFGWTLDELRGQRIPFVSDDQKEMTAAKIDEIYASGKPVKFTGKRLTKRGKTLDVMISAAIIKGPSGKRTGMVVNLIDISEQIKLERQLRQAQKMESVGRLAGGVAHDYNNMLSVIIGYAELALEKVDPSEPLYDDLQKILNAGRRSADITRQLLAFARQQTIAPRVLDLNATVEGVLQMLRRLIGEDINLAWLPGSGVWPVKMDPTQLDQILANLCVNARDAISDVGKITIETDMVTFDEAYCADHAGFVPGDFVMLAVSDNGCGMDRQTLDNLFEPFFTTKGVGKGTGLGLATVYGIVKQNKGFINVYSEPGRGTTFKIYLRKHTGPLIEDQPPRVESVPRGRGEMVLVVEDEPSTLKLAERMLTDLGYQVLIAENPSAVMQLAAAHTGAIALLVTDVVMPGMNGRDLADQLRTLYPDLKTLFMSGYTANVIAHHGVLDAGVQFIQKPFSKKDLATKVRQTLDT